jgi:hypothetical protein
MRDRLKKCAETYRMDPEKLAKVLEDYSSANLNDTDDVPEQEMLPIGTEPSQTNILLSPPLNTSGSSGMDGHELGDHDDKQALRNHLRRRLAAKRYMSQAAELKGLEQGQTIDDENLDGCGVEPGPEHSAWSDILKKRREKLADQNTQTLSSAGGPGVEGIAGGLAQS